MFCAEFAGGQKNGNSHVPRIGVTQIREDTLGSPKLLADALSSFFPPISDV